MASGSVSEESTIPDEIRESGNDMKKCDSVVFSVKFIYDEERIMRRSILCSV